jgi:hypothetical protein
MRSRIAPHFCVACGKLIRWALAACFDCMRLAQ